MARYQRDLNSEEVNVLTYGCSHSTLLYSNFYKFYVQIEEEAVSRQENEGASNENRGDKESEGEDDEEDED